MSTMHLTAGHGFAHMRVRLLTQKSCEFDALTRFKLDRGAPTMKMLLRSQWFGTGEATTRSLDSAIMAPSLNTASSTIRMVGKYLHPGGVSFSTKSVIGCLQSNQLSRHLSGAIPGIAFRQGR